MNDYYPSNGYYTGSGQNWIDRFIIPCNQAEGDEFIQIVGVNENEKSGAAIIRPHSKYKGNIVISTTHVHPNTHNYDSTNEQARSVPMQHFLSYHAGVEKVFWYEFQNIAIESDKKSNLNPEHFFGIVEPGQIPKKAFLAHKAMVRAMPPTSVMDSDLKFSQNEEWGIFHWKRNDGLDGWCLWSFDELPKYIYFEGEIHDSFDLVGDSLNLNYGSSLTLTWDPIYIIGPTKVNVSDIPPPSRTPYPSPSDNTSNTINPTISDENSERKDNKGHTKVIICIVVAVIVILLIIAAAVAFILIKKRRSKNMKLKFQK